MHSLSVPPAVRSADRLASTITSQIALAALRNVAYCGVFCKWRCCARVLRSSTFIGFDAADADKNGAIDRVVSHALQMFSHNIQNWKPIPFKVPRLQLHTVSEKCIIIVHANVLFGLA